MTRLVGSGRYTEAALATERLLAAKLASDSSAAARASQDLRTARARGYCGMTEGRIATLVDAVVAQLALPINKAIALPVGGHADVIAYDAAGDLYSFEVKAQTTKLLQQLVEADWIRQETDWLAAQVTSPAYAVQLPGPVAAALTARHGTTPTGWTASQLLASDLAVLPSQAARTQAGVATPADLLAYARRKWLVQIAQDGARIHCIADLPLFQAAIGGLAVQTATHKNVKGLALRVRTPSVKRTEFTYHVYARRGVFTGRHKMHAIAVRNGQVLP